ncbi:MAG: M48 family metalloprotease [Cytophagales bacterium]|nr:M48 family metalloprotease [Cytophagales bacterium]
MKRLLYTVLCLLSITSFAQQKEYQPLKAQGNMPKDFTTLSSEKYEAQKKKINKKEARFEKKAKDDFYLKSNYHLHDLLYSGRVLYNDKVSNYVKEVAEVVLEDKPNLHKELRFYTLKSSVVNAFATDQGMLFFNLGLIAQVENEAQLAMIISHEITHYTNKHSVNRHIEKKKILRGKGAYRSISWEDRIQSMSTYSKENEMEADLHGFKRYKKTNYSYKDAQKVFDVLRYSYLPFDDIEFKKSFLESEHLKLPESYFLKSVNEIGSIHEEDNDDEGSTHPSIRKRVEYIKKKTDGLDNTGRVSYIVGEQRFKEIQKIARHELCNIYLNNLQYEKALYNAYLILQNEPNDLHARKTVMKALYGLSKYKNAEMFYEVHGDYTRKEGASQKVYFLMDTITSKELNTVALNYAWRLKQENTNDKEISLITEDLMKDLVFNHTQDIEDFSTTPHQAVSTNAKPMQFDSVAYNKLSKYEKIEYKQKFKESNIENNPSFDRYAFVGMMNDEFTELFEKFVTEKEKKDKEENLSAEQLAAKRKKEKKENKRIAKKGRAFGIDKIIVVDPSYNKIDERKGNSKKLKSSENAQISLQGMIRENAQSLNLDVEVMDNNTFQSNDTKKYNDFVTLNNWLGERAVHLGNEIEMVNINQNQLSEIQDHYGTKYVTWIGYTGVREKKENAIYYLCISCVYPIFLPVGIYYAVNPEFETYMYCIVFDIEKGEYVWIYKNKLEDRDSKSLVKGTLYDLLYQIKSKRTED